MREGNFVRRFIAVFGFVLMFVLLVGGEAKADLLKKVTMETAEKRNKDGNAFDPNNNIKDHCWLMVYLNYEIGRNRKDNKACFDNVCRLPTYYYIFNNQKWHREMFWIIYQLNPFKILGRDVGDETVYEAFEGKYTYEGHENEANPEYFSKLKSYIEQTNYFLEKKVESSENKKPKDNKIHYIKTRGCYIEETNINIKNLAK